MPEAEYRFDPSRKWRFDWAFVADKIALEVEGGVWTRGRHLRGKGYLGDLEKYNAAAIQGWCVLRVTPDQLTTHGIDLVIAARRQRQTAAA